MGFLDGFLEKLGASLATKYGHVVSGKHKGCSIALGNPPKAKVSTADSFSQIIFLEEKETKGRYNINEDIADIKILSPNDTGYLCSLTFENGDTCEFNLYRSRTRVFVANLDKCMLKETREFFENELKQA